MKFYKVLPSLKNICVGDSYDEYKYIRLFHEKFQYVKMDKDGYLYDLKDRSIFATRKRHEQPLYLQVSREHLSYFEEIKDPGPKQILNLKYEVHIVEDYAGTTIVSSFDTQDEAVQDCIKRSEEDDDNQYEVHISFDYQYVFETH